MILKELQSVQNHFPNYKKYKKDGVLYFDNAATTLKPDSVINELIEFYTQSTSNVFRGIHKISSVNTEKIEAVRFNTSLLIDACQHEIVFSSGATESINMVSNCLQLNEDDEIIISSNEHHSNILPWLSKGVKLVVWDITKGGNIEELRKLISNKTKLISLISISNVTGNITPFEEAFRLAKQHHIFTLLDASQSVSHKKISVKNTPIDFMVFSSHKMFGPSGVGVLYVNQELHEKLTVKKFGGGAVNKVTYQDFTLKEFPYSFEPGTPNIENILGFGKALEFILSIGYDSLGKKMDELDFAFKKLILDEKLAQSAFVPEESHTPIFSLIFPNAKLPAKLLASLLADNHNVIGNYGYQCAQPLYDKMKLTGALRISLSVYNEVEEIETFAQILHHNRLLFN